jgi:hypothetical protein
MIDADLLCPGNSYKASIMKAGAAKSVVLRLRRRGQTGGATHLDGGLSHEHGRKTCIDRQNLPMTIVTAQMSVSVDGFYAGTKHTDMQTWLEGRCRSACRRRGPRSGIRWHMDRWLSRRR